jgi:DHA1 family bicyclomycin/chloramphenicol resistance-like MFS transporter
MTLSPRYLIILLASLVAFGPLSIDMYLPSLPLIATSLNAIESDVQKSITVFLFGLFLGMLLYGPLSDKYGRKPPLLIGIGLYFLASFGCAMAQDIDQLLIWRFIQALGGGAASVLARAIVRDIFAAKDTARILSLMHLVTMVATLIAPLLGGYLILFLGWRIIFILLMLLACICFFFVQTKIQESRPETLNTPSVKSAFNSYFLILKQPTALCLILCNAFSFSGMFAYITGSSFVYIQYYGTSAQTYAWLFSLNIAGIFIMTLANAKRLKHDTSKALLSYASHLSGLSGVAIIVSYWLFDQLTTMVLFTFLYISVTGVIAANSTANLLNLFAKQAGAAAGLAVAIQFGLGAIASFFVGFFFDASPKAMVLIMSLCGLSGLFFLKLSQQNHST